MTAHNIYIYKCVYTYEQTCHHTEGPDSELLEDSDVSPTLIAKTDVDMSYRCLYVYIYTI